MQIGIKELSHECYKFVGANLLSFDSLIQVDGTMIESPTFFNKVIDCSIGEKSRWLLIGDDGQSYITYGIHFEKIDFNIDGQWITFCDDVLVSFGDYRTTSYSIDEKH